MMSALPEHHLVTMEETAREKVQHTSVCSCPGEWAGLYCSSRRVPCYGYDNPCISGTCCPDGHDVKCDCPLGKTAQFCDQGV